MSNVIDEKIEIYNTSTVEKKLDNLRLENDKKNDILHALHIDNENQDGGQGSKNSEENK